MMARRLAASALLVLLLAGAGVAVWRSAAPQPESARTIAAQLLCPACQGESVAQSQSPMAAAMRDTIAQQLAAGRSPRQVRQYFVDRYGPSILSDPPHGGLGVVLWIVPIVIVVLAVVLAWRVRRRGARAPETARGPSRLSPQLWDALAAAVVVLVAVVAVASPHQHAGTAAAASPQPSTDLVALGRSLESQGRYAEAAAVYQDAVTQDPDDAVRLRLAFALLRSDQAAQAVSVAGPVVDRHPDDAQALLLLGLAQRAQGSTEAAATLHRFLKAAPNDPAAGEVRRLLGTR
ncbi:cytochrome c-type biogenesis protein CcmH [Actinoplanes sp. NPDC051411]|uniref:cytochrome c-type biogenesis protein CcmH n=1 Tax=unclassified Actinoplanes TaxID=2626549 RepID=UPI003412142C